MATLTYWTATCLNDSSCYNFRCKTKKECLASVAAHHAPENFGPVHKVTVEYNDAFDLMTQCLTEGSGWWELNAASLADTKAAFAD